MGTHFLYLARMDVAHDHEADFNALYDGEYIPRLATVPGVRRISRYRNHTPTYPRYLTAFGSTLSEIIVPVVGPVGGRVIGTVDVESERANAFSASDQQMIEQCAQAALPLWLLR